ncbi:hypothetical protein [Neisseria polysaccharea]|uniref:Transposase n=1 Tax=Neisseria polysaccharea TaxID=489 RepID=A0ABV1JKE1_NEIPO
MPSEAGFRTFRRHLRQFARFPAKMPSERISDIQTASALPRQTLPDTV